MLLAAAARQRVCLFSEGLDSLCGLANRLQKDTAGEFLAVSALTQNQCEPKIENAIRRLNLLYGQRVGALVAPLQRADSDARSGEEPSQRTRSFLLLAVGAAAALMGGTNRVEVFENGIEMLNFPFEPCLTPEHFSRAMHPITLARMSAFLSALTTEPFLFAAPFVFHTKTDLVRSVSGTVSHDLLRDTVSCMHFPQRNAGGAGQCGLCAGCTLRHMAFRACGVADPAARNYHADIFADEGEGAAAPHEQSLFQMDQRVWHLQKALDALCPEAAVLRLSGLLRRERQELLQAAAVVGEASGGNVGPDLLGLMKRYASEWADFQPHVPRLLTHALFKPS